MLSTDSEFKKLLLLHSRDRREKKMLDELKNVPLEISRTEENILIEKKSIEMAMDEWKSLEEFQQVPSCSWQRPRRQDCLPGH